jgi:hypothetical protein
MTDDLNKAREALKIAREAITRYAKHDPSCPENPTYEPGIRRASGTKCDCGLEKARIRIAELSGGGF